MDARRNHVTRSVLDLTLEIIYLLTGEDYGPIKKETSEWSPHLLMSEKNNDKKILEVTQKIIDLLTGEVPIRCQDVTVYFSMEEWEYLEGHKDLYKDVMMDNQPPLTSPDGSSNGNPPERCPRPLYSRDSPQELGREEQKNLNMVMVESYFKEEEEEVPIDTGQDESDGDPEEEEAKEVDEGGTHMGLNVIIKSETEEEEEVVIKKEEVTDIIPVYLQKKNPQDYRTRNDTKSKERLSVWKSEDVSGWGTEPMASPKILAINHQTLTGDKPFSCAECGGFFKHKSSLVLHRRIHSGEKPYSCSECGKQFIQKANYLRHQRLHTGEKPYKCTECGKEYAQKQSLVMHQKFHAENEPFSCPECGANFIRQSHLVNHRKTHKGFRRYTCPDCGDFFMLRSSLVIHQRVHSAEKPFSS
ncbi:oocyte zinc finger protein XlCOF8.4-like isoform X3 [Lithobates pipiens]